MATIRDVAHAAGVSPATVSLVVNGADKALRIADATRQRVLAAADALGYVADPRVRALRRGHTRTILAAFVARQVPDEFFVDILHALDREAAARSRDVQFQLIRPATAPAGSGAEGDDRAATPVTWDALRSASKASAGVILVGGLPPGATEHATTRRLPVPAVQIGAGDNLPGVSVVRVDNRHAGRAVAKHLLAFGHRTTALLGPTTWYAPFAERREGYLETVRAAGGPEPLVVSTSHPDAATIAQLRQAGVTAVVCLYDRLALALLRQARAAGIRIPTDWSLAGFDDMDWSAALSPSLTTVRIPRARLAAAAVERLEALIAASTLDPPDALSEPIVVIPELIVRESTASKAP